MNSLPRTKPRLLVRGVTETVAHHEPGNGDAEQNAAHTDLCLIGAVEAIGAARNKLRRTALWK